MAFSDDLRRVIDRLKGRIDLHDLADKLGLERPGGRTGNYRSPHHTDKTPSLSIFPAQFGTGWKDHSSPDDRGDCVALYQYVHGGETVAAVRALCEMYDVPFDVERTPQKPAAEKSRAEHIADKVRATNPAPARQWLIEQRGLLPAVVDRAIQGGAVGFNDYRSLRVAEGQFGHCGPAAVFVVRSLNPGHVMAVDMRYIDPALNGGTKTSCQGEKDGYGWTSDVRRLRAARTVYVVESPINALSLECVIRHDEAAFATRGTGNVENIDFSFLRGKQVVAAFDNDEPFPAVDGKGRPHPQAGVRPGLTAAWRLHERLTALDISVLLLDQSEWQVNDLNDFLTTTGLGIDKLRTAVRKLEQCAIPGLHWNYEDMFGPVKGRRRLCLPFHHDQKYWRFRVRPDFTFHITVKMGKDNDEGGEVKPDIEFKDVAGFRIASISRLELQSDRSTLTGDPDQMPTTSYSASVQTTRGGAKLSRQVFDDTNLHNIDRWKRFGPVWDMPNFLRLVNILECGCEIGARKAVNFVGLCWKDGVLAVNEGPDCYFQDPQYQCRYHSLIFPSGPKGNARRVLEAYQQTFANNQALFMLTWALGGHFKAVFRFWPHAKMEADKGSGKSTLIGRLCGTIGMSSLSQQTLKTEYRMVNSIAYTTHPVCWEEFSRLNDMQRSLAINLLQETYQFQETTRAQKPMLLSGPVLIAGEDVPVEDIAEKLVRFRLNKAKQGAMLPLDLPQFPVRQWLEFLASVPPEQVRRALDESREFLNRNAAVANAQRIVENYAAMLTAWKYLAEFAGLPVEFAGMARSIVAEMNDYLHDAEGERHPWIWIMQTLLAELASGAFESPAVFTLIDNQVHLAVRTSDVMHHIRTKPALRGIWDQLPVKSDRILKRQLVQAGVVAMKDGETPLELEKMWHSKRVSHLTAISVDRIREFGLHAVLPPIEDIR